MIIDFFFCFFFASTIYESNVSNSWKMYAAYILSFCVITEVNSMNYGSMFLTIYIYTHTHKHIYWVTTVDGPNWQGLAYFVTCELRLSIFVFILFTFKSHIDFNLLLNDNTKKHDCQLYLEIDRMNENSLCICCHSSELEIEWHETNAFSSADF